jgi:hypothetical protein
MVSAKNKRNFWKTVDAYKKLPLASFPRADQKKILSVLSSRKGIFKHTPSAEQYLAPCL